MFLINFFRLGPNVHKLNINISTGSCQLFREEEKVFPKKIEYSLVIIRANY
jgi:hypothetical protein